MSLNFAEFLKVAPYILGPKITNKKQDHAGFPLLMKGHTGIGKSEVARRLADAYGLELVDRRASQMTEGDLVGMPVVDGKATSWLPPDFYLKACEKPVFLFLDEYDRGVPEVRQGFFELADSRKLNGHHLHPGTKVLAAINGGLRSNDYQVQTMDRAECDRWWTVEVDPTPEDWLSWAMESPNKKPAALMNLIEEVTAAYKKFGKPKTNIDAFFYDFINQNLDALEHRGKSEPGKVYPTRRSWKRFNDTVVKSGLLEPQTDSKIDIYKICLIGEGFVGLEVVNLIREFHVDYEFLLTPEELLAGKGKDKYKKFELNDHTSMLRKLHDGKYLHEEWDEPKMRAFVEYTVHLPKELLLLVFYYFGQEGVNKENIKYYFTYYLPKWHEHNDWSIGEYFADCIEGSEIDVEKYQKEYIDSEKDS